MQNLDDIQYAFEQTRILQEPDRRIDTFGDTKFTFLLLTEPMDSVGQTRIRSGEVEAERPKIVCPEAYMDIDAEGFSEEAKKFFDWLKGNGSGQGLGLLLKYGFRFRRTKVEEELIHESIDEVRGRILEEGRRVGNPMQAIVEGIDDNWEICLLKFTMEMIQKSHGINIFDFQRKGLF